MMRNENAKVDVTREERIRKEFIRGSVGVASIVDKMKTDWDGLVVLQDKVTRKQWELLWKLMYRRNERKRKSEENIVTQNRKWHQNI